MSVSVGTPGRLFTPIARMLLDYSTPPLSFEVWSRDSSKMATYWGIFLRWFQSVYPASTEHLIKVCGDSFYGRVVDEALKTIEPPRRVLDLGTGTGFTAFRVKRAFPQAEVIGIDLSPDQLKHAERKAAEQGLAISFELGDITALRFEDESFDLVIQQNGFTDLGEFMRVLQPGHTGLIAFTAGGIWLNRIRDTVAERVAQDGAESTICERTRPGGFLKIVKRKDCVT